MIIALSLSLVLNLGVYQGKTLPPEPGNQDLFSVEIAGNVYDVRGSWEAGETVNCLVWEMGDGPEDDRIVGMEAYASEEEIR